ncbi:MAG TPA: DUF3592 domain-containing protein [Candidatus Dormibacteraeota bacterium]|nr:DUF3592 domain-containing protein [Candidatus Dormibacteraeota bacterium]
MLTVVLFLLLGLVLLILGFTVSRQALSFLASARRVSGTIISVRLDGRRYRTTIRFVPESGRSVETEAELATLLPAGRPGATVRIAYDPARPTRARVDRVRANGVGLGAPLGLLGCVAIFWSLVVLLGR